MEGEWVPIVLFIVLGFLLGATAYFRFRARQELQITIRSTIETGRELTPEVMQHLIESLNPPNADLRRGAISIAIGLALVILGVFVDDVSQGNALMPLLGVSAFPFLIGAAYLILWQSRKGNQARSI